MKVLEKSSRMKILPLLVTDSTVNKSNMIEFIPETIDTQLQSHEINIYNHKLTTLDYLLSLPNRKLPFPDGAKTPTRSISLTLNQRTIQRDCSFVPTSLDSDLILQLTNWTPLMIAASVGCAEIVSALISRGADVNAINETGQTSLHYVASKNREEIVRILLANHANINAADNMGSTPLHRAASKGNIKILKIFLEDYSNQLDVDARDCVRNTPLHLACEEERMEAAKMLIEAGASIDTLNKEKKNPIEMARPQFHSSLRRMAEAVLYP
ncbi:hypothetical protein CEXT_399631 [Caerostris extrusa]|uniref:Uncharacterized protein n=1 Tax=Caerostris extrusa TaxID=172846 RepID=A0AAV4Y0X3_CAEEX|nr:hypothetical protein CEXT_399631 [Caerostris extrusa]